MNKENMDKEKNKRFQLYFPEDQKNNAEYHLHKDMSKYDKSTVVIPKKVIPAYSASVDAVIENTEKINIPVPAVIPGNASVVSPSRKSFSLFDIGTEILDSIIGTYNPNNPLDANTIVEGIALGEFLSQNRGKTITQKALITAGCIAADVTAKRIYHNYKNNRQES